MTDIFSGTTIVNLQAGLTLKVLSADVFSSGLVRRTSPQGANLTGNRITNVPTNTTKIIGPFPTDRMYSIEVASGKLSYFLTKEAYDFATQMGNVEGFTGSFTLKTEDNGKVFRCDDTANVTVTVDPSLPQGFNVGFAMWNTGSVSIANGVGAINRSGKTALSTQYQSGTLIVLKQATTGNTAPEYTLAGDFA